MAREISYRCYCACGGAANPRLFSRDNRNSRGDHTGLTYHDAGFGPLTAWATHVPPPNQTQEGEEA